eukprot:1314725-Rhodomonas_salina.3
MTRFPTPEFPTWPTLPAKSRGINDDQTREVCLARSALVVMVGSGFPTAGPLKTRRVRPAT